MKRAKLENIHAGNFGASNVIVVLLNGKEVLRIVRKKEEITYLCKDTNIGALWEVCTKFYIGSL